MTRRLLMVEDDPTIAEMYRLRLTAAGWEVRQVGSGEAAQAAARELRPALVVLDIMLPGIDGVEVLRRLRADPDTECLQVVVLSNSAGLAEADAEVRRLGVLDWLVKSRVSPSQLAARLEELLHSADPAQPDG